MNRTFFVSTIAAVILSASAAAVADGSYDYEGRNGGYAQRSYSTAPGAASRTFSAQGAYDGSAMLYGNCAQDAGCCARMEPHAP